MELGNKSQCFAGRVMSFFREQSIVYWAQANSSAWRRGWFTSIHTRQKASWMERSRRLRKTHRCARPLRRSLPIPKQPALGGRIWRGGGSCRLPCWKDCGVFTSLGMCCNSAESSSGCFVYSRGLDCVCRELCKRARSRKDCVALVLSNLETAPDQSGVVSRCSRKVCNAHHAPEGYFF